VNLRKSLALAAVFLGSVGGLTSAVRPRKPVRHNRTVAAKRPATPSWRTSQMQPDADRVKEIQESLVKKGYLKQDATGTWTPESADALRRFQTDQSLEPTGKLDSLSIIALGLGPQHESPEKPAAPSHP
jgi:hypothetical protein